MTSVGSFDKPIERKAPAITGSTTCSSVGRKESRSINTSGWVTCRGSKFREYQRTRYSKAKPRPMILSNVSSLLSVSGDKSRVCSPKSSSEAKTHAALNSSIWGRSIARDISSVAGRSRVHSLSAGSLVAEREVCGDRASERPEGTARLAPGLTTTDWQPIRRLD